MSKVTPHAMEEILNRNVKGAAFRDGEQVVAGPNVAMRLANDVNNLQAEKGQSR